MYPHVGTKRLFPLERPIALLTLNRTFPVMHALLVLRQILGISEGGRALIALVRSVTPVMQHLVSL